MQLQKNEMGVTEHIEGDQSKFAVWLGQSAPVNDQKIVLRVRENAKWFII